MAMNPQEMLRRLALMNQGQAQQPQVNPTLPTPPPAQDWQQHLATLRALREKIPVGPPVPVGTPTLSKLQMEESTRQADRQFEADERYRAAQLALARLRAGSGRYNFPAEDPVEYRNIQGEFKQLVDYYAGLMEEPGGIKSRLPKAVSPLLQGAYAATELQPAQKYTQEQSIQKAIQDLMARNTKLGLSTKQINETIDWIYGVYGLDRSKKEPSATEQLKELASAKELEKRQYYYEHGEKEYFKKYGVQHDPDW